MVFASALYRAIRCGNKLIMINQIISFLQETSDLIFWNAAIFGSVLFFIRLCTAFIGGFGEEFDHIEDVVDGDIHHQFGLFKLLTLHTISGFFMMFGWIGLACIKQYHCNQWHALFFACSAGLASMIVTAFIFKWSRLLISSGERFTIEQTVGMRALVYQQISHHEQGKIQIVVGGVTREILAQSQDGSSIESFSYVKVVDVVDHETVLVEKI